ncbi:hypothetical protein JCM10908_005194 [Rhodotorula pacifica]|uniref:uncharacterized protein n=1 Tax=Rhodotorula pacifica TaxID=1495444 RepID=UPI00317DEAB9
MGSLARLAAAALFAGSFASSFSSVDAATVAGNENYTANLRIDKRLVPAGAGAAYGSVHRRAIESESKPPMSTSSFIGANGTVFLTVYGERAQTYTLDKTAGSFGLHSDLVPVAVIDVAALDDCAALQGKLRSWEDVDDVFSSENFMKGIIFQSHDTSSPSPSLSSCFESYNPSFLAVAGKSVPASLATAAPVVASFFTEADTALPQGPYMAEVSGTGNRVRLSKVYRVYRDEMQAFTAPAVPDASGNFFYQLSAEVAGMNTLSIPVPSRIYTWNVTSPRPLEGMRVAVKDIYNLAGFKTGCGNRAYFNLYDAAETSAYSVQKLIDDGAIIVGKVKTSQFANGAAVSAGWFDQLAPYNPRGDGYQSPSTSSAGSAAGLAAYDWLDFAIGSDTGGSIRYPAGACGLYGLRPSWGALSLEGVMPMASRLDTPGFFARSGDYLAKFGKAWFADTNATRAFDAYPAVVRAPEDLIAVTGAARPIYNRFVSQLAGFLGGSVDNTSYYGQWNETIGQEVGADLLTYGNASWTVFVGYYQSLNLGDQFFADYESMNGGRRPTIDATVQVRWDYGRQVGLEGYNEALDVKAHVKEFAERYLTPTSNTTCSESLFVYPNSDGSSPNYRTYFPTFPGPAFGWGPQTTCIYADSPEITIPIGQVPYNSTVDGVTEYLPVTVNINAAAGCDYMLFSLAESLHDAGIISEVKTGRTAF